MSVSASLLQDWEMLQQRLMPPLLEVASSRAPRVWTVGCAHDAIAVAVAYHHAWGDLDTAAIRVYLSARPGGPPPVHFGLADVRCLPGDRREQAFRRLDRRYVPRPLVMERVILAVPAQPVDLVTVRARSSGRPLQAGPVRAALQQLRKGGYLLLADPPSEGDLLTPDASLRAIDQSGRLFQKTAGPSAPATGEPPDGPFTTLAARADQARLVEDHYNLARSLARRFAHHGEMAGDLEQVALLALVKAAGRFRPDHGSSFATFATSSILGELKRHFRDRTWMLRVPRSLQEAYLSVKAARDELGQTLGTSPTVSQIASHLGISEEAVLSAMEAGDSYWPASLDTPRRGDESEVTEIPTVDGGFESSLDLRQLRESLPKLDRRERLIIKRLYFDGWTQKRVADELGVSQMQVSRLMARTLTKLRASFGVA